MNKNILLWTFIFGLILTSKLVQAQSGAIDSSSGRPDLSIPSTPAFTLLDENPSKINKVGFMRDFKIDWVLKDGKVPSNMAIELAPLWLLYFSKQEAKD